MAQSIVRRVWWLVPVVAVAAMVVAAVAAVPLISYAFDARNKTCAEDFESAALSVSGVVTADFTCTSSFGNPQQKGRVTLEAETEDDAVALMESVLRAYAQQPDLEDAKVASVDYVSEDGSLFVAPSYAGFNGNPSLGEIREHYGLQGLPEGTRAGPTGESFRPLWGAAV